MINAVRGILVEAGDNQAIVLASGVEYRLWVSNATMSALPEPGSQVRLLSVLVHREDQMKLYGFISEEERVLYTSLTSVDGVGPKQAMKILSGAMPEQFVQALETENVDFLSHIPGVGAKTAQKMILALKGKLVSAPKPEKASDPELVKALVDMGFDRQLSLKTVERLEMDSRIKALPAESREAEIFRLSILELGRMNRT